MHRHTLTFLRQMRGRGGFSIELCPKANHLHRTMSLHLQGAVQFPGGKEYGPNTTVLRKKLKSYLGIRNGAPPACLFSRPYLHSPTPPLRRYEL